MNTKHSNRNSTRSIDEDLHIMRGELEDIVSNIKKYEYGYVEYINMELYYDNTGECLRTIESARKLIESNNCSLLSDIGLIKKHLDKLGHTIMSNEELGIDSSHSLKQFQLLFNKTKEAEIILKLRDHELQKKIMYLTNKVDELLESMKK